jgi:hypothetical protein
MSWQYDQRFPTFEVDGVKFALTFQDDDFGTSAVLLYWTGNAWNSWGGTPDVTGIMVDPVTPEKIMAKGSLREFMVWLCDEAVKRAKIKAKLPAPSPDDRVGRFKYHLMSSIDWDGNRLVVPPAPLNP